MIKLQIKISTIGINNNNNYKKLKIIKKILYVKKIKKFHNSNKNSKIQMKMFYNKKIVARNKQTACLMTWMPSNQKLLANLDFNNRN